MTELIVGYKLIEKFRISPNDLLRIVQKGDLSPRDMFNKKLCRPDRKPAPYIESLRKRRDALEAEKCNLRCKDNIFLEAALGEPSPVLKLKQLETEIEAIDSELKSYNQDHQDPYRWKGYSLPGNKAEAIAFMEFLCSSHYLMEEVNAANGGKGLSSLANEVFYLTDNSARKNMLPSQRHKQAVIKVAMALWEADPAITIAEMADLDVIHRACDGNVYGEQTIRKWIKKYCPNREPGRRPKAKKP